jgi:hypothetical protein
MPGMFHTILGMSAESTDVKPEASNGPLLTASDIEAQLAAELIERRRSVRTIPCPEAIERDDEESWSTWNELMAQPMEQSKVAKAMAAVVNLLRRKD